MNKIIETMWKNRGYTNQWLEDIEKCDHVLPSHIHEMCARLKEHHDAGDRVVLLTDFDTDGIMTGVIGFAGLSELGFSVSLHIPDTGGYGIGTDEIDRLADSHPDAVCLLTGDVGITEHDALAHAEERGLDVLVTDHHVPGGELPDVSCIVDPMLDPDDGEHFREICGAAVMYLVLREYAAMYACDGGNAYRQIERLRVFAGIGTVSDEMPVLYENRALVRDAVSICRMIWNDGNESVADAVTGCPVYRRAFLGLYILLTAFYEAGKFSSGDDIHEDFFGFYLAPVLNSLKRIGSGVSPAYHVFFGGRERAVDSMSYLLGLNDRRKKKVADAFDDLMEREQEWAPYVYVTDAPGGIRGLLAQKVKDLTGLPALVVAELPSGEYAGSGRTPGWFPFLDEAKAFPGVHPAGHQHAFGVTLESRSAVADYARGVVSRIAALMPSGTEASRPDCVISCVSEDADFDVDIDLFDEYLSEIDGCRPFGVGFPVPDMELEFSPSEAHWSYIGDSHMHLKAVLPKGLTLVCFGQAKTLFPNGIDESRMPETVTARGYLNLNVWNGTGTIQFIGDLDPSIAQPAGDTAAFSAEAEEMLMD